MHASTRLHPLREGDTFCCGDWKLQVIEIPGHTYGSVAFADFEKKVLFSGDSVQKGGPIYLFGSHRNLNLYIQSERKLEAMACRFETIYPCHHFCPVTPDYIGKNRQDAEALQAGILPNEPTPRHALSDLSRPLDRLLLHRGRPRPSLIVRPVFRCTTFRINIFQTIYKQ